jgi:tRNA/rRNA methyltransferase
MHKMRIYAATASSLPPNPPHLHLNTTIILVAPKVPGNIGSVLRVGANFAAAGVTIVDPRCDVQDPDVYRLACDSPLLPAMQVLPTLKDALQDMQTSIGFTRRAGKGRITYQCLKELTTAYPSLPQQLLFSTSNENSDDFTDESTTINSNSSNVALVFGREESGLLDSEVQLCVHACAIPSSPSFPSLNLSHAVGVVMANLFEMGTEIAIIDRNASGGEFWCIFLDVKTTIYK